MGTAYWSVYLRLVILGTDIQASLSELEKTVVDNIGDGFGSMFAKMGRVLGKKILPKAVGAIKKVASKKSVKDIGNLLLEKGMDAAAEITGYFYKFFVLYSIIAD